MLKLQLLPISPAHNMSSPKDKNDWHTLEAISLLAQLAALLHDLGKASVGFQKRLRRKGRKEGKEKNLYRHEWVSLRLFQAFVGQSKDEDWLRRLADGTFETQIWIAKKRYFRDGIDDNPPRPFSQLPPLAAAVAWLILTHHRLPLVPVNSPTGEQRWLGTRSTGFNPEWFNDPLSLIEHNWNEEKAQASRGKINPYWTIEGGSAQTLPVIQPKWKKEASRLAIDLLKLHQQRERHWLDNPYVMHLARLSLMLADHYYSSLPRNSPERVQGEDEYPLFANTDSDGPKQALDEHLLGVARDAGLIANALPNFEHDLRSLINHTSLCKRSTKPQFSWQDKASDTAASLRETAREHGAFIVNMASTGCGKTLANARILYALSDPEEGMRTTYALGLRTLTLQTGNSYRNDLHLSEKELATIVGGSASRALFDFYQEEAEDSGSASTQALLEEDSRVHYEGETNDNPLLTRALSDSNIAKLLSAPMLVCTIDHLTPATESLRGGRQIAPMLRLMSSDLILDELDDYDLNDMPALTRLVYWAGMLGTRVVLSSATLPPSLVEGMYQAWRAGRIQYRRNRGNIDEGNTDKIQVPCLWVDEFSTHHAQCSDTEKFTTEHAHFIQNRASQLKQAPPLQRAELVPLNIKKGLEEKELYHQFALHARKACMKLHHDHAELDPVSGKRVSFGIIRMANIAPLFEVAQAMLALGAPEDTRIHLCVYHSRFPLIQRSAIEHLLDNSFNRKRDRNAVYHRSEVRTAIEGHREEHHLFIVLASPTCEVGRDWDADWAVAEPSSMRALIQLAGRIQRHRRIYNSKPNLLIFETNLRYFIDKKDHKGDGGNPKAIYINPGFEMDEKINHRFRLVPKRKLGSLLEEKEYKTIAAIPRICPRPIHEWRSSKRLVDLEHARIAVSMLPRDQLPESFATAQDAPMQRDEATWSWRYPRASLTGVLPQQQPFRERTQQEVTLVFLPDESGGLHLHRIGKDRETGRDGVYTDIEHLCSHVKLEMGARVSEWKRFDLMTLLAEQKNHLNLPIEACAKMLTTLEVKETNQKSFTRGWWYHPLLGLTEKR